MSAQATNLPGGRRRSCYFLWEKEVASQAVGEGGLAISPSSIPRLQG